MKTKLLDIMPKTTSISRRHITNLTQCANYNLNEWNPIWILGQGPRSLSTKEEESSLQISQLTCITIITISFLNKDTHTHTHTLSLTQKLALLYFFPTSDFYEILFKIKHVIYHKQYEQTIIFISSKNEKIGKRERSSST